MTGALAPAGNVLSFAATALAAFGTMEAVAWASHKYLMHGPLWFMHRSHHLPRRGSFEANDLFGIFFSLPAMALIALGVAGRPLLAAAGMGMTGYGLAYLLFHDAIAHGRFGRRAPLRNAYVLRLIKAHRLHHARAEKDGCRSFGFLLAPPRRTMRPPTPHRISGRGHVQA